jgi:hypothetical protein
MFRGIVLSASLDFILFSADAKIGFIMSGFRPLVMCLLRGVESFVQSHCTCCFAHSTFG